MNNSNSPPTPEDAKASTAASQHSLGRMVNLARDNMHYLQPAITGLLRKDVRAGLQGVTMGFRDAGISVGVDELYALKERPREVVLMIHGLMGDEIQWFEVTAHQLDLGKAWAERYDVLPLYLRYNTGDHISHNGQRLANLLEHLVSYHRGHIERLRIVAHSMGGLVFQSAVLYALRRLGHTWPQLVRSVLFLGAPHNGAGLERMTRFSSQILDAITVSTRAISRIVNLRSHGIQDIGYG